VTNALSKYTLSQTCIRGTYPSDTSRLAIRMGMAMREGIVTVLCYEKRITVFCQRINFFMKSIFVALRKKSDSKMPSCDMRKSSVLTYNVTGCPMYSTLMDPSVSILPSVIPLRKIDRSFRICVSGCRHFFFIRCGAALVSTINSVSRRKPLVKIVTVGAYEKLLGFKIAIRHLLRWLIGFRSRLSDDFDFVIFPLEARPPSSRGFPCFPVADENY